MVKNLFTLSLLVLLPIAVSAQVEQIEIDGIYYNLNPDGNTPTAEVTSNPNWYSGEIVIPSSVTYEETVYSVTRIGVEAFQNCDALQSVIIPEGVSSIGEGAFQWCNNLLMVELPSTITSISEGAFVYNKGASVPNIISHIVEPFAIVDNVFGTTDDWYVSNTDPSPKTLLVPEGTKSKYQKLSGWNKFARIEEGEMHETIYDGFKYEYYTGSKTATVVRDDSYQSWESIKIPASIAIDGEQYNVTAIGDRAFEDCWNIQTLMIPNSVTFISNFAFHNCGIRSLTIPTSVKSIGDHAFENCSSLQSVIIPEGVESIGECAFLWDNNLSKVELPSTLTSIGKGAFVSSSNASVPNIISHISNPFAISDNVFGISNNWIDSTEPSSATLFIPVGTTSKYQALSGWTKFAKIEEGELLEATVNGLHYEYSTGSKIATVVRDESYQSLENVEIPPIVTIDGVSYSVTAIGDRAFEDCWNIRTFTIPNSVTSIGKSAFRNCGFTYFTIPNSVKSIDYYAFGGCGSLQSVIIPEGVESVGECVFLWCHNLSKVELPSTLTSIGEGAFASSRGSSVPNIISHIEEPFTISNNVFGIYGSWYSETTDPSSATLFVPVGTTSKYQALPGWNRFAKIEEGELKETTFEGLHYEYNPGSKTATVVRDGSYLENLTTVEIPATITVDGVQCNVTAIGDRAFENSWNLTSVTIPNSVTSIGNYAFQDCNGLTSLTIPSGVTSIGEYAFRNCSSLTSIVVEEGNTIYDSRDNCNALIETGTNTLIVGCSNSVIPGGVTSIGAYAFQGCNGLTSLTIPGDVTSIGASAFQNCSSLQSVNITEGVESIGECAFLWCYNLSKVELPSTLTSIGEGAFASSRGSSVPNIISHIEEPFTISNNVFGIYGSWYSETTDPSSATLFVPVGTTSKYQALPGWNKFAKIEEGELKETTFEGLHYEYNPGSKTATVVRDGSYRENLTTVEIPATITVEGEQCDVTAIGDRAFEGCRNLQSITIPNSVTSIGNYAFQRCYSLTSLTISNGVTSIGDYAFENCGSLQSVIIPEGVVSVGEGTFLWCHNLSKVELPSTLTSIGEGAFASSRGSSVPNIISHIEEPFTISNNVFGIYGSWYSETTDPSSATLFVPVGTTSKYQALPGWNRFAKIEEGELKETTFEGLHYEYNPGSKTATVVRDGSYLENLTTVEIPATITVDGVQCNVTAIGDRAFENSWNLTSVTIPNSVTSIGNYAFQDCNGLTSLTIPSGVTSIGEYAFRNCSSLTSIVVEEGNTIYDSRDNCNAIIETATNTLIVGCQNTIIPNSVKAIGNYAFGNCAMLQSVNITEGVESIGECAFQWCYNLSMVVLPSTLTSIGEGAFVSSPYANAVPNIVSHIEEPFAISNNVFGTYDDWYSETTDPSSATLFVPVGSKSKYEALSGWNKFAKIEEGELKETTFEGLHYEYNPGSKTATVVRDESYRENLTTVEIPATITVEGEQCDVTVIGDRAFEGCWNLQSIMIPNSVTSIGKFAFSNCFVLASLTIPNSVTSIGDYAFRNCYGFRSVIIPEGVVSIGEGAFLMCYGLSKVILPSTLTNIGKGAFVSSPYSSAPNIVSHILEPFAISDNVFGISDDWSVSTDPSSATLFVPEGSKSKYEALSGWNKFAKIEEGELMEATVDGLHYEYNTGSKTATVIRDDSYQSLERIEIPATFAIEGESYNVTAIGDGAFSNCWNSTSVTIPNSLTSIGKYAFQGCSGFTSLTIPSGVTSIGEYAFIGCWNLTSIVVEDGNPAYDSRDNCNALIETASNTLLAGSNSSVIPGSVTSIVANAFDNCYGLTSVTIPCGLTSIGEYAFHGCTGLTSIVVEDGNPAYDSRDNCNALIETATNTLIVGCQNTIIPNTVKSIGNRAFENCYNLQSVIIPEGVESIGEAAFLWCHSLSKVVLPSTITSIGEGAFVFTQYANAVPHIISHIMEPFEISVNVFGISNSWYVPTVEPSPKTLFVPVGSKSKYEALSGWNMFAKIEEGEIMEATIDGLHYEYNTGTKTAIVVRDESYKGIERIEIPSTITIDEVQYDVTAISDWAFEDCWQATSVTIPNSVTSIGAYAFRNCHVLTSLTIPNSVTSIGENAFRNCNSLTSIVVEEGNTSYDSRDNCNALIETATNTLIVGCQNTTIPNTVKSIGDYAFENRFSLQSVIIPEGVESIGEGAFLWCSYLSKVELPSTITSIGEGAFVSSPYATAVPHIISHITEPFEISANVFGISGSWHVAATEPSPKTLFVPEGTTSKYQALSGWNKFAKIDEGELQEAIVDGLHYEYYTGPKTAKVVRDGSYLENLTSVEIPATIIVDNVTYDITEIGDRAFEGCKHMTSITIPNSVTSIHEYAFRYDSGIKDFYSLAENVPATNAEAFSYVDVEEITLHVPVGCVETYQVAPWDGFKEIVEIVSAEIALNKSVTIIEKGKTEVLTATITPSTLDQSVTWESSNTSVATVSSAGKVKGVRTGTATITCTSKATGLTATCEVTVGSVKLDQTEIVLEKSKTMTLTATVYPSSLEDKSVTWESSDTKIATVTSDGKVKGVKTGTATITCTSKATGLSATCEVTVGSVKLDQTEIVVEKTKTKTLKATVYPSTLEDKTVTWTSSNTAVATVSSKGKVKGVKTGTATITCTSNATGLSATCEVTVGSVKLNQTEVAVNKGKTVTLKATVYPSTLEDKTVTWTSSNTKVATVSSKGKVKGVRTGTATITCTSNATGLSTTCEVTVGSVMLDQTEVTVNKGKTVTLKATVYPSTLEDKSVIWESSNTKVATVTSAGKVKGIKAGTATITCTSVATGLSTTCTVTVTSTSGSRSMEGDDDELTGIEENVVVVEPFDVYDLSGRKVRHQVTSLDGLSDGIYIVNGKKILKKK